MLLWEARFVSKRFYHTNELLLLFKPVRKLAPPPRPLTQTLQNLIVVGLPFLRCFVWHSSTSLLCEASLLVTFYVQSFWMFHLDKRSHRGVFKLYCSLVNPRARWAKNQILFTDTHNFQLVPPITWLPKQFGDDPSCWIFKQIVQRTSLISWFFLMNF